LIGGTGADELDGDKGDDLLIGGYSVFDTAALELILDEWSSPRGYDERVDNLRNGTGAVLLGSSIRLQAAGPLADRTVADDGVEDELKGGSDRDWFFADLGGSDDDDFDDDDLRDHNSNELIDLLLDDILP
jgi:Ca2+-binding RTX toxin-like protein